jgi:hypothetical protein
MKNEIMINFLMDGDIKKGLLYCEVTKQKNRGQL